MILKDAKELATRFRRFLPAATSTLVLLTSVQMAHSTLEASNRSHHAPLETQSVYLSPPTTSAITTTTTEPPLQLHAPEKPVSTLTVLNQL